MNARRSFLSRLGITAAAVGLGSAKAFARPGTMKAPAGSGGVEPSAESDSAKASAGRSELWQPARDARDDWFDQIPGRHRLFFDTLTDTGLRDARAFANNYFDASKSGYGLEQGEIAVVICLRHRATPFAFNDTFWAKYGPALADSLKLADPKTAANPHKTQLEALIKRGVHLAVCDMASHRFAGGIARKMDGDAEAIYKEMVATVAGNAHFVAAGIVAVNRAQERGYSIAYTG
jgi:hypothetical protein